MIYKMSLDPVQANLSHLLDFFLNEPSKQERSVLGTANEGRNAY